MYEGFGFPILDSLRHGTPVLASCTSSMGEFDNPGIFFFDPQDPATVDLAWQRLEAARPVTIPKTQLDDIYSWDFVVRALLDTHAQNRAGNEARGSRSRRPGFSSSRRGAGKRSPRRPSRRPGAGAGGFPCCHAARWGADRNRTVPDPDL